MTLFMSQSITGSIYIGRSCHWDTTPYYSNTLPVLSNCWTPPFLLIIPAPPT